MVIGPSETRRGLELARLAVEVVDMDVHVHPVLARLGFADLLQDKPRLLDRLGRCQQPERAVLPDERIAQYLVSERRQRLGVPAIECVRQSGCQQSPPKMSQRWRTLCPISRAEVGVSGTAVTASAASDRRARRGRAGRSPRSPVPQIQSPRNARDIRCVWTDSAIASIPGVGFTCKLPCGVFTPFCRSGVRYSGYPKYLTPERLSWCSPPTTAQTGRTSASRATE